MFVHNLDEDQVLYEIRELKDKYPFVSIEKIEKQTRNENPELDKEIIEANGDEDTTTLTFKFSR